MTVQDMIDYLRLQIHIQDKNGTVASDEDYLTLSDKDLHLFLNVALSRENVEYSLDEVPSHLIYPLILQTKKELFLSLAVKYAPEYDLTADNNNSLRESQKFTHYMELVAAIDAQYQEYMTNSVAGANTLNTFDVLLSARYYTQRNVDKGIAPALYVKIHKIYSDSVEVSWIPLNINRLAYYKVFIDVNPIYDKFETEYQTSVKVREAVVITDPKITVCRITGLAPSTLYYLAVQAKERNGLQGIKEITFVTENRR